MKQSNYLKPIAAVLTLSLLAACGKDDEAPAEEASDVVADEARDASSIETVDEKISYAIGYQAGARYANDPVLSIDQDLLIQGILDGLQGTESKVSEDDAREAGRVLQERFQEVQAGLAAKAQAAGEAFLKTNAAKEGVVTTESGLQYEVISEGDSDQSPTAEDQVKVHYHGTLVDGTIFDSSVQRGQPATFRLNGVIRGWTEGLQLMSVGDKYRFFIPSELAYGAQPPSPSIPPNSVLIFEVELLGIGSDG